MAPHLELLGIKPRIKLSYRQRANYIEGQLHDGDPRSKIVFELDSKSTDLTETNGFTILQVQVSLDNGLSYSQLQDDSHTILSSSSIFAFNQPTSFTLSPKLIDRTQVTNLTKFIITAGYLPLEPSYSCKIVPILRNSAEDNS